MAASAIYFFKLFLLSRKQIRELVGLLLKSQIILTKSSKSFILPDHVQNFAFN